MVFMDNVKHITSITGKDFIFYNFILNHTYKIKYLKLYNQ